MNLREIASCALDEAVGSSVTEPVFAEACDSIGICADADDTKRNDGMKEFKFKVRINLAEYAKRFGIKVHDDTPDVISEDCGGMTVAEDAATVTVSPRAANATNSPLIQNGVATPLSECRAENPMTCRYHGSQAIANDVQSKVVAAFNAAGREFAGSIDVGIDNITGGIMTCTVSITAPEADEGIVESAMRSFLSLPGIEGDTTWGARDDEAGSFDYPFDIKHDEFDFDRLNPDAHPDSEMEQTQAGETSSAPSVAEEPPSDEPRSVEEGASGGGSPDERRLAELNAAIADDERKVAFMEQTVSNAPQDIGGMLEGLLNQVRDTMQEHLREREEVQSRIRRASENQTYVDRDGVSHVIEHNEGGIKGVVHPSEVAAVQEEMRKAFADAGNDVDGAEEYAHALSHFLGRGNDARSPHPGMRQGDVRKYELAEKMKLRLKAKWDAYNNAVAATADNGTEENVGRKNDALADFKATEKAVQKIAEVCGIGVADIPGGDEFGLVKAAIAKDVPQTVENRSDEDTTAEVNGETSTETNAETIQEAEPVERDASSSSEGNGYAGSEVANAEANPSDRPRHIQSLERSVGGVRTAAARNMLQGILNRHSARRS